MPPNIERNKIKEDSEDKKYREHALRILASAGIEGLDKQIEELKKELKELVKDKNKFGNFKKHTDINNSLVILKEVRDNSINMSEQFPKPNPTEGHPSDPTRALERKAEVIRKKKEIERLKEEIASFKTLAAQERDNLRRNKGIKDHTRLESFDKKLSELRTELKELGDSDVEEEIGGDGVKEVIPVRQPEAKPEEPDILDDLERTTNANIESDPGFQKFLESKKGQPAQIVEDDVEPVREVSAMGGPDAQASNSFNLDEGVMTDVVRPDSNEDIISGPNSDFEISTSDVREEKEIDLSGINKEIKQGEKDEKTGKRALKRIIKKSSTVPEPEKIKKQRKKRGEIDPYVLTPEESAEQDRQNEKLRSVFVPESEPVVGANLIETAKKELEEQEKKDAIAGIVGGVIENKKGESVPVVENKPEPIEDEPKPLEDRKVEKNAITKEGQEKIESIKRSIREQEAIIKGIGTTGNTEQLERSKKRLERLQKDLVRAENPVEKDDKKVPGPTKVRVEKNPTESNTSEMDLRKEIAKQESLLSDARKRDDDRSYAIINSRLISLREKLDSLLKDKTKKPEQGPDQNRATSREENPEQIYEDTIKDQKELLNRLEKAGDEKSYDIAYARLKELERELGVIVEKRKKGTEAVKPKQSDSEKTDRIRADLDALNNKKEAEEKPDHNETEPIENINVDIEGMKHFQENFGATVGSKEKPEKKEFKPESEPKSKSDLEWFEEQTKLNEENKRLSGIFIKPKRSFASLFGLDKVWNKIKEDFRNTKNNIAPDLVELKEGFEDDYLNAKMIIRKDVKRIKSFFNFFSGKSRAERRLKRVEIIRRARAIQNERDSKNPFKNNLKS